MFGFFKRKPASPEPQPTEPIEVCILVGDVAKEAYRLLDAYNVAHSLSARFAFWTYITKVTGYDHTYSMKYDDKNADVLRIIVTHQGKLKGRVVGSEQT